MNNTSINQMFRAGFVLTALMSTALVAQAANVLFTGAGSDQNFSTTGNWDAFPATNDVINISVNGTSPAAPAVVDSGFGVDLNTAKIYSDSSTAGGVGMAYAEVVSGGTLKASNVEVGNADNEFFDGTLIVRSGGTVENRFLNSGSFDIGGGDAGEVGIMTIENGATVTHSFLKLETHGSLTFEFGANSVSTFNSTRATTGGANTLNGLLTLDLGALTEVGTYTLINSGSANLLIAGALKTWLDGDSGTRSGTGNIAETNFAINNNIANFDWSLTTANGGQDLTFTVIPEPNSFAFFAGGLMMALVFVRRKRHQV